MPNPCLNYGIECDQGCKYEGNPEECPDFIVAATEGEGDK